MTAIMDVSFPVFQSFRQKNPVFFWTEDRYRFVLLKSYNDAWLRTVVKKSRDGMADKIWAETNLIQQTGAFYVEKISNLDLEATLNKLLKARSNDDS